MIQPAEFTAENVSGFPVKETLLRFLGELYEIEVVLLDSVNFGLPVARLRSYQVGRHKFKTLRPRKSLTDHCQSMIRPAAFGWEELFWATNFPSSAETVIAEELKAEWEWAASRPSSQHAIDQANQETEPVDINAPDACATHALSSRKFDWMKALSEVEQFHAQTYELRWPQMAFSLNQNPEEHGIKSSKRYLQTFIHNFGLVWTFNKAIGDPRWLSSTESLVGMGFPCHPLHVHDLRQSFENGDPGYVWTSFNVRRDDRKPASVKAQCGNSDSLLLAAVSELFGLLYLRILGI